MQKILHLAQTDFKIIFRDPSLKSFLVLPLLLFAVVIFGLPYLVDQYEVVTPYLPILLALLVIENTQMFCFISSMVLLDEKETSVAKVYGVVPLSLSTFLLSRFLFPCIFTVLANIILLLIQPFYDLNFLSILLVSIISGMIIPVYVLAINSFVENRMQGMVYIKAFNIMILIPFAAFFVPEGYIHLFGLLPTHWLIQATHSMQTGQLSFLFTLIAFLYFLLLGIVFTQTFVKSHFKD